MFIVKFGLGNAAFAEGDYHYEIARILIDISEKVIAEHTEGKIFDYNGNKIGEWKYA